MSVSAPGYLVDLARLQTDESVLDHVDPAEAVLARKLVHAVDDLVEAHQLAVERDRNALLEADLGVLRIVATVALRIGRERVDVRRRLDPRVFEHAALDRTSPQVVIDRVRALLGRRHGYVALHGVDHLLLACLELPLANRRDDLEVRVETRDADLEANLIVALAGAAVTDVLRPTPVSLLDEVLHDDRPGHGAHERILVLVERIGLERPGDVLLDVLFAHVFHDRLDGTDIERLLTHELEILALLAHVDRERHDIEIVVLLNPLDRNRGVQSTRIREYTNVFVHVLLGPFRVEEPGVATCSATRP